MASEQEVKDMIKKVSTKYFNDEIKLIPQKIEDELSGLTDSEKLERIQGLTAFYYSQAALKASTDTLAEVIIKSELHYND